MAVDNERETTNNGRGHLLRATKWIRLAVIVVALGALAVFLFKVGLDPADAGKKSGH